LNHAADVLARHLRTSGVGPDVLVGIHCERSLEMLVSIFAVLKAGGAYVPLDPSYPRERIEFMISDSGLKLILSMRNEHDQLVSGGRQVIELDHVLDHSGEKAADLNPINQP